MLKDFAWCCLYLLILQKPNVKGSSLWAKILTIYNCLIDAFLNFLKQNFILQHKTVLKQINIFNLDNEANSNHRFGVKNHSFKIQEVHQKSHTITTHD